MTDEEFEVVEAMSKYGGSFVQALAECFHRADSNNFEKLKNAFPEYWKQYEEMAAKDKQ
jgi:pyruvate/2-oxoacid:ferredoxin oxidoreductase beta subunit